MTPECGPQEVRFKAVLDVESVVVESFVVETFAEEMIVVDLLCGNVVEIIAVASFGVQLNVVERIVVEFSIVGTLCCLKSLLWEVSLVENPVEEILVAGAIVEERFLADIFISSNLAWRWPLNKVPAQKFLSSTGIHCGNPLREFLSSTGIQ